MRQYRERKLTDAQRMDQELRERVRAYRHNPAKAHVFKQAWNERRREIYRARKVLEADHPLSFRGSMPMTVEEALYILRDKGTRDLIKHDPKVKPPKHKGRPRTYLLDSPAKVNDKIREMMLAAGLKPASPQLLPDDPKKDVFSSSRPVKIHETEEQRKQREERNAQAREAYAHKDKASSVDTGFRLPQAVVPKPAPTPDKVLEAKILEFKQKLISQGKNPDAQPAQEEAASSDDIWGDQVFDFTPGA